MNKESITQSEVNGTNEESREKPDDFFKHLDADQLEWVQLIDQINEEQKDILIEKQLYGEDHFKIRIQELKKKYTPLQNELENKLGLERKKIAQKALIERNKDRAEVKSDIQNPIEVSKSIEDGKKNDQRKIDEIREKLEIPSPMESEPPPMEESQERFLGGLVIELLKEERKKGNIKYVGNINIPHVSRNNLIAIISEGNKITYEIIYPASNYSTQKIAGIVGYGYSADLNDPSNLTPVKSVEEIINEF